MFRLRSRFKWATLAAVLVAVFYPVETTVVPLWPLKVVDEQGMGVEGTLVREIWQHYSIETESHEQELISDTSGDVVFPARKIRSSILLRVLGPLRNFLQSGVHASFGPDAYAIAFSTQPQRHGMASYKPKAPLPERIVLKPMSAEKAF